MSLLYALKVANLTSQRFQTRQAANYTAQLHPSDLVQLKLKMESISFLLLKKR